MLIRKIIFLSFAFCLLPLFGGCGSDEVRLIELVPSSSNMVEIINWSAVRKDDGLKRIIGSEMFEKQIRRFGIDEAKVSELIVFSTIRSETQGGLLFRGSFDGRKTLAALKAQGWNEDSIDGRKVYSSGKDFAFSPSEDVLAAGTRDSIAAIFRAMKDSKESLTTTAAFKKIRSALSKNKSPVAAYLLAPDGTVEAIDAGLSVAEGAMSLFDMGGIVGILKHLNFASGVGFTIARGTNGKYSVNLSALMRDEKTAKIAAGSLSLLQGLSAMIPADSNDRENVGELQDFNVTREENVLLLKMQMPEKALLSPNGF